jgi:hypothetical protein
MAKEYEIFSREDIYKMVNGFESYFRLREEKGLPFQKIRIISKRWVKSKSSPQHKSYWLCVSVIMKKFRELGYDVNQEDVSQFIKKESGFTKMIGNTMVTKSIADNSDDATIEELTKLIDFMIRFAAEKLDIAINLDK